MSETMQVSIETRPSAIPNFRPPGGGGRACKLPVGSRENWSLKSNCNCPKICHFQAQSTKMEQEVRMQMPILRKWQRVCLVVILLLMLLYSIWARISAPQGDQKVVFAPARESCGSAGRLKYCIYRARSGANGDVVYHLHGRNLDEKIWNDDTYWTSMVQAEWQRTKTIPPTVVTLSYGSTWLLAPKGKQAESGLLDDLMMRLPEIEAKIGSPRRRMLLGESMGGLNVLITGLSFPDKFSKIAALCPGVYATSPFGTFSEMNDTLKRTGADPKIGLGIWLMAKNYVADEREWERISPLSLIEKAASGYPAMYLSNGLYDAYGNFEGTQRLADAASLRGVSVEWHPIYGGHCATDIPSLARFLAT